MTPAILLTIQACATAVTEFLKFAQTEQGQKWVAQRLTDEKEFRADLVGFGDWVVKLVSGELTK